MQNTETLDLTVIIPFRDHSDLTVVCLNTLQKYAPNINEVLLINNNSTNDELKIIEDAAKRYNNTRVIDYPQPFNFQKMNNWAAKQAASKTLFFLNNDIELTISSKGLIECMYLESQKKSTGAVGAVLLYEGGRKIQHAGVYLKPSSTADHLYIGKYLTDVQEKIKQGVYPFDITKNLKTSAVTAAALMVTSELFNKVNGYNENFIIGGGDVDLCLRLNDIGHQSILIGSDFGVMLHKESQSRSSIGIPYVDFYESYRSYVKHFDNAIGDPFLPWKEVSKI